MPTVFGAEITLTPGLSADQRMAKEEAATLTQVATGRVPDSHAPDPHGDHLLLLADGPEGYARLARTLSLGHLAGEKGAPQFTLGDVARNTAGDVWVLTGCRKGAVPAALVAEGPAAARRELHRLIEAFGRDRVLVELWDHGDPLDSARNDALAELAARNDVGCVATTNAHYATPAQRRLATALGRRPGAPQPGRARPLAAGGCRRPPPLGRRAAAPLRPLPGRRRAGRRGRTGGRVRPGARRPVAAAVPVPGRVERDGVPAPHRRGGRPPSLRRAARRRGERDDGALAWQTIDHELAIIEQLGFAGYFLVVWDLVRFCREQNILCQGRGSAANSAVCYALGVTAADAVTLGLLFERFLSPERDGPPDIDIDIESDRREEVIQYVYGSTAATTRRRWPTSSRTGPSRRCATWPRRSATRRASRTPGPSGSTGGATWRRRRDSPSTASRRTVLELAAQVEDAPRHLGIHSGGMVICDRPVIEVCPVEWGRMEDRSVLQWDKDDCAAAGLVKFDLLGLGMLSALHYAVDLIREHRGYEVDLATIPQEDDGLRHAVPGRHGGRVPDRVAGPDGDAAPAQAADVLRPRGRGGADPARADPGRLGAPVHPPAQRPGAGHLPPSAAGEVAAEDARRAAVPGAADADGDRRRRVHAGRVRRAAPGDGLEALGGADGAAARAAVRRDGRAGDHRRRRRRAVREDEGVRQLRLPRESHSVSFAYLVYASSWIKYHEPAAFCAALLNAQPMGFWSPHTLVQDARRHGVVVRTPGPQRHPSPPPPSSRPSASVERCRQAAGAHAPTSAKRSGGGPQPAVRLGIGSVRGLGEDLAKAIEAERVGTGRTATWRTSCGGCRR